MSIDRRVACLLVTASLQLGLGGCSDLPATYRTSGKVVYSDGAPVSDARIELRCLDQPYSARGKVDRDGKFVLTTFKNHDGAVAGKHQVLLIQRFSANVDDMAKHREHIKSMRTLDTKYASYSTSGLEIEVDPKGDNTTVVLTVE